MCEDIRSRANTKINDIEAKIETLQKMKAALERLTTACKGRGPVSECPILEVLEDREK